MLKKDEKLLLSVRQKKFRPAINVDSLTITERRLILKKPSMFGVKKTYADYPYADINSIELNKGLTRSSILLNLRFDTNKLSIDDIPNSQAQEAFKVIRERIDEARRATSKSSSP